MNWFRNLTLIHLCLLLPAVAFAIDLGESVQIHGFLSQGYLYSSNNNFLTKNSASGDFEFTESGLNANWAPLDALRLGGQVYFRKLGDYSENEIVFDWALIDYQPFDWLGFRAGKVKMPMGFFNENRDTDFVLPMVFLPQAIYDESRRDSNLAYIGGGIYGNVPTGRWGDVDYHFFVGENDFPDNSILEQATENSLTESIKKNNGYKKSSDPRYNPLLPSILLSHKRENEELYGGAMVFNTAVDGLRLGFSLLASENAIYVNGDSVPLVTAKVKSKFVLSLEYAWNDLALVSEYGETDRKTIRSGVVTMDGPTQAWYVMLNYAPFERWTFSALYDEFYRLKDDKDGETSSIPYMAWRKDFAVAARYDLSENWVLKAEYHYIDGGAMQMKVTNPPPDGVDRYWNYFVAKFSFSF